MPKYVALLRGINVGGRHSLPMAECRRVVTDAGGLGVTTYIQSGNLVFEHDAPAATLVTMLAEALSASAGFDVPVMVRTAEQWADVLARNPFGEQIHTTLHVAFLDGRATADQLDRVRALRGEAGAAFAPERLALDGDEVYLHLPDGIGRSKLAVAFGKTKVTATVRNWRTVEKLSLIHI